MPDLKLGVTTDQPMTPAEWEEHSIINGTHGKKVFVVDSTGNMVDRNSSTLISYNALGECVYIDETFNGHTYRTTFTRDDMTITSTLPISAMEEL